MTKARWSGRGLVVGLLVVLGACSADGDPRESGVATSAPGTGASTGSGTASTSGSAPGTSQGQSGTTVDAATATGDVTTADATGSDAKFDVGSETDSATGGPVTYPVRMIPGLVSITFYERTGGDAPVPFIFDVDGAELTTRLDDPLSLTSFDIDGATDEYYDVYYSDVDGGFDIDGRYLTISGQFVSEAPAGGGLNLAEIGLNFEGDAIEFGNDVASYVILGDNAAQPDGNVESSIDGDLQTHTTMGNTVGADERLRVTLGFPSSSGPQG